MKNLQSLAFLLGLLLIGLTNHVIAANQTSKNPKADVRLLIDISGSMKKNDPHNLRIPALQLVTNLLPKGSDAGVWAFGRYINMLVPLSSVDEKWQRQATLSAKKINSKGLYTNIGSVLEKASYGWDKADPKEKRSLVLLTDGMVDISKDPAINAKERKRILTQILPKLKKGGVAIHTIALSQNADHELLKALSTQTDGWYQAVNNAAELERIFLKIFEQAAARDNLPITDNLFSVDKSIEEMTVLVFRQSESLAAKLITPSGEVFNKNSKSAKIRWFSTQGYDLITLSKPATGQWKIDAKVDPDNRVMVVSKLGLSVADLPNNLLAGEAIKYQLQLLEEGQVINNPDFLKLVDAKLEQDKNGQKNTLAMFYDGANHAFKQNFFTDRFEGELKLRLQVSSPTFERERTHAINIYGSPLVTKVEISPDNIEPHKIFISVREDIVKLNSLSVNTTITKPNNEKIYLTLENFTQPLEIAADLANGTNLTGGKYQIAFKISGQSVLGRKFSLSTNDLSFTANPLLNKKNNKPTKNADPETEIDDKIQNEVNHETNKEASDKPPEITEQLPADEKPIEESKPEAEKTPDGIDSSEQSGSINWLYVGLGMNLVLAILGFFVWRLIKKRSHKNAEQVSNELGIDDDDDEKKDEAEKDKK